MISSEISWAVFNNTMNQLREAIISHGLILLLPGSKFVLDEPIFTSGEEDSRIVGIYRESNDISIIVQDKQGEENDFELYSPKFHIEDFIYLLENLEKYEHNS